MKEVEILVRVLEKKERALCILAQFQAQGTKHTIDTYYYDSSKKLLSHPTEWLRIRDKDSTYHITYKNDHFKEGKWFYSDEYETSVSDKVVMEAILHHLGYVPLLTIDNTKHIFTTDEYEIVLEEVKELGLFLEVERISVSDDEQVEEIRRRIQSFIDNLGFSVSEELHTGKPELMLKKRLL